MKKLLLTLGFVAGVFFGFSQTVTYSFLPPVNNGNGTQTLTLQATSSSTFSAGSWSVGRMGLRIPLSATGHTDVNYGQNFGANGGVVDANFTNVVFTTGPAGGFSDPIGSTTGITTFLLADVGGTNDGYLYVGMNWSAPPNSGMTAAVPVTVLSFRVPASWNCPACVKIVPPGGFLPIEASSNGFPDPLGLFLGAQFDLNLQQSNISGGGSNIAIVGIAGTLPVTFGSFDVKCVDNGAMISWVTSSEQNTKNFEVQKSTDGVNWSTVGTVAAAGNSSSNRLYQFLDVKGGGTAQYRIKQIDFDGKFDYSTTRVSNCKSSKLNIVMYPVPANDKLNLIVTSDEVLVTDLRVIDVSGKVVYSVKASLNKGITNILIPTQQLPGGQYVLVSADPTLQIQKKFTVGH
jgi:hypothetical protein